MSTRPPSLVVAARAILLVLAAVAATFAFVLGRSDPRTSQGPKVRYVCPMHPDATAAVPGSCPICGMALSEVRGAVAVREPERPDANLRQQGIVDVARRRVFSQEQRGSAWVAQDGSVRALLYQDEVASLEPGERAEFHAAGGAPPIAVRLGPRPPVSWDTRTSTVDFVVERTALPPRPGAVGWLELSARPRSVLIVSSAAVLDSSEGPYVLASADGRSFTRRPVAVGKTLNGLTTVLSGLREQERVLIRGAFFVDSQARLGAEPVPIDTAGQ